MQELPADLAEPLHLLNPYPWSQALVWLAALIVLAVLWRLWRRWRRRSALSPPRGVPPPPPPSRAASGIEEAIAAIRDRFQNADLRRGCHELSETLRSHFEGTSRHPLSTLTAREIARIIGNATVASLFELLAELQFRRRRPSRDEFREICNLAVETVEARGTQTVEARGTP